MANHTEEKIQQKPKNNKAFYLLILFVLFWTPVVVFSKIAGEIIEKQPIGIDISILNAIHQQATPFFDQFFLFITNMANVEVILPFTLVILAYFIYKKQRQNALILLSSVGGAAVANFVLKLLFHRNRPSLWHLLITETGYSFPSGHAMLSSALVLSIIFIIWKTRLRWPVLIIGIILVGLIGLSRVYLGVHYPTDVIAGWSVSLVWVIIVLISIRYLSVNDFNRHRAKTIA